MQWCSQIHYVILKKYSLHQNTLNIHIYIHIYYEYSILKRPAVWYKYANVPDDLALFLFKFLPWITCHEFLHPQNPQISAGDNE